MRADFSLILTNAARRLIEGAGGVSAPWAYFSSIDRLSCVERPLRASAGLPRAHITLVNNMDCRMDVSENEMDLRRNQE